NGGWRQCARGTTIGMRRLLRTKPITGDGFRYWIEQSRGAPKVARFSFYRRPLLLQPPAVHRNRHGLVTITADAGEIRYTLDGSPVGTTSALYGAPIDLPNGGTVRAAVFAGGQGRALALGTALETAVRFGMATRDWKVLDCSSQQGGQEAAEKAFDGDPRTHWHTRWSPDGPGPPHHLAIDLGRTVTVNGFVYQPRTDGSNGTIADYEFHGSTDGKTWQLLAKGTFPGIEQNPVPQVVEFAAVPGLRYVELVAMREVRGRAWASCAELSVLVQ
ncbi:MAG TPA: discoidin domain-containing protein, partial [Planctomycetota bacterium]|nr:discoidin domain-containing protein [Planctomycetota bacterium]